VFSAGVVIWELLALRRLFPADQEKEPGDAVLRGEYPRLAQYAALAGACRHLLSERELGWQMGRRGRERVLGEYHPSRFIAGHEDLYAGALERDLQAAS
jgi:hypothetical protein